MLSNPASGTDAGNRYDDGVLAEGGPATVDEGADAAATSDGATACVPSTEVCDGKDNDCDGQIDEEPPPWYCDADGDGFAANANGRISSCDAPSASASCGSWTKTAPTGPETQDCDDTTALRFPGSGFGASGATNGDLNCDGQIETRLEFVEASVPGQYSSTTQYNICEHNVDEVLGGNAGGECDCWFSTALAADFTSFSDGPAKGRPYFLNTFPCAEKLADVIILEQARTSGSQCVQGGTVAVRQLCR